MQGLRRDGREQMHRGTGSHLGSKPEGLQRRQHSSPSHTWPLGLPPLPSPFLPLSFLSTCIGHLLCSSPDGNRGTREDWDMVGYLTLKRTVVHPENVRAKNQIIQKYRELHYLDKNFNVCS